MAQPSFDSILNAVMMAESGGRRYDEKGNLLTSPKGAKGELQVLDKTKFSPGFGVEPAKANTPDERARVGRDYLKAMLDRYGDVDKALAAYNWGPGNTDKWIARGADPAKLPDETKKYISRIKTSLTSEPRATAQAPAQALPEAAVPPAPAAGAPRAAPVRVSEARPADLGPSYQAALALSFLSDEGDKEERDREYDERQPSISSQWLARETRRVSPESLAMPFSSPFAEPEPEPVKAADGGFIAVGYNRGGEARIERIKRTTPGLANLQNWSRAVAEDMYPREEDAPKRDAARHMLASAIMANKTTPGVAEFLGKAYEFKEAPIKTMGHMLGVSKPRVDYETDTFNNALGTRFAGVARDPLELQRAVRASIEKGEANLTPDEVKALGYAEGGEAKSGEWKDGPPPVPPLEEPAPVGLSSMRASRSKPQTAKEMLSHVYHSARDFVEDTPLTPLGIGVEGALLLADRYKLMPPQMQQLMDEARVEREMRRAMRRQRFKDGGEVSDEPTPEELERASKAAFGIVPSSGKGRKQGRVSEALQSGEAQKELAKGLTMLPQNVVGAPVDLATLAMRPFGYRVEKPVMGSEWLKEKSRAAGVAFQEPTDPTLRAFFQAGDISSNLVNPAGATRTAVRGVEKTGEAAKELAEFATRPVERDPFLSGPMGAQRGAVRMPGTPDPTLAYLAGVPSAEKPFVGRLDQHVAGLSGTMQKEQFLNSLKGKFRDYDLARASEALADLGPTDKIKPVQILERLKTTYSPQNFRTIINEPQQGLFHQGVDNVYYNVNQASNPPLGAVSLALDPSASQEGADKAASLLENLFKRPSLSTSAEEVKSFGDYLRTGLNMAPEDVDAVLPLIQEAQRVGENFRTVRDVKHDLEYPSAAPNFGVQWSRRYNELLASGRTADEAAQGASKEIKGALQKEAFGRLKSFMPSERVDELEKDFFSGNEMLKNTVLENLELSRQVMSGHLRDSAVGLIASLPGKQALNKIEAAQSYKGQHETVNAGKNPIGFSRFSEHTAQVPGMGEVPLMHFHELQSDLMQDVRRYGPAKGSKEADQKELAAIKPKVIEAEQALKQAEAERRAASARVQLEGDKYAPLAKKAEARYKAARGEYDRLYSRESTLEDRIDRQGATYRLPQPFAGMEASPQVVQQLLVKNAVNAAIQRGKSGATFPGKESQQPQLYENLLNNLKQVAKDLGPGFEVRPITLQGPNYTEFSHYGIFWGPEAAARIQKKGVPFKDGGMVERVDDTRRYL